MKLVLVIVFLSGLTVSGLQAQTELTVKDTDGNKYKTVKIGKQVWLAENLKTTKYCDGTTISYLADTTQLLDPVPSYFLYNNDSAYKSTYGLLYNWYVVNTGKLCPAGWHVPSHEEWSELATALGGEKVSGGKLKETGTIHWDNPNKGATNETGFTGLPGGYRSIFGSCEGKGSYGAWWSSTVYGDAGAYIRELSYDTGNLSWNVPAKNCDYPVRCLKN